jgi:hypothetical protein
MKHDFSNNNIVRNEYIYAYKLKFFKNNKYKRLIKYIKETAQKFCCFFFNYFNNLFLKV